VGFQIPIDLLLQQFSLNELEELFGVGLGQAEMLNAVVVLLPGDDIGHGLFTAITVAQDELEFDTHGRSPPGGWASE
jgi:hypothetical protein